MEPSKVPTKLKLDKFKLISKEQIHDLTERILPYMADLARELLPDGYETAMQYWVDKNLGVKMSLTTGNVFQLDNPSQRYPIYDYIELFYRSKNIGFRAAIARLKKWVERKEKVTNVDEINISDRLKQEILKLLVYYHFFKHPKESITEVTGSPLLLFRRLQSEIKERVKQIDKWPTELLNTTAFRTLLGSWSDDYFFTVHDKSRAKNTQLLLQRTDKLPEWVEQEIADSDCLKDSTAWFTLCNRTVWNILDELAKEARRKSRE